MGFVARISRMRWYINSLCSGFGKAPEQPHFQPAYNGNTIQNVLPFYHLVNKLKELIESRFWLV